MRVNPAFGAHSRRPSGALGRATPAVPDIAFPQFSVLVPDRGLRAILSHWEWRGIQPARRHCDRNATPR